MSNIVGTDPVAAFHRCYRDREAAARARHHAGQKVVGYFSNNVPEELILAAGLFPVQLTGDPREPTDLADIYLDEVFDGNIKSIFQRLFAGHFDFVDLVIVPRTAEAFLQLYYFVQEARKWEPDRVIPELYLFDLLQTPFWITNRYDRGRLEALRGRLESLAGAPAPEQALARAISVVNADRRLLREAAGLWREPEPRLCGVDALAVIGSGWFMDRGEHATLLRALLDNAASLPRRAGPRLMIKGSPHDNADFYTLVEQAGAVVVASDHVWGDPTFAALADEQGDPMEALTAYYQLHSPSPRSYPQAAQDQKFLALTETAKVKGVVFYHDEHDDTLGWDYPDQKALLDARGIPSMFLKRQSYRHADRGGQLAAIRDFVATIAERDAVAR